MTEEENNYLTPLSIDTRTYNPADWGWQIADDDARWWSSKDGAWSGENPDPEKLTIIDSIENLDQVLRNSGLKSPLVLPVDVHAERDRRLAAGFEYDFGDSRGVHLIRTSPADMIGWDEVTKLAQAQINLKTFDPNFEMMPITIATGTGVTQVTPIEWQHVMIAASNFRQPIWAASFFLETLNPIPDDYADDSRWP